MAVNGKVPAWLFNQEMRNSVGSHNPVRGRPDQWIWAFTFQLTLVFFFLIHDFILAGEKGYSCAHRHLYPPSGPMTEGEGGLSTSLR